MSRLSVQLDTSRPLIEQLAYSVAEQIDTATPVQLDWLARFLATQAQRCEVRLREMGMRNES